MTTENDTLATGDGEALPAVEAKAPKSDAEAKQQEAAQPAAPTDDAAKAEEAKKADAAKQDEEKKRNRTRDYIERKTREAAEARAEAAELRRQLEESSRRASPAHRQPAEGEPDITQYSSIQEYTRDLIKWEREQYSKQQTQAEQSRKEQETLATYSDRAAQFADEHPDFVEAVGSIDPQFLTPQLQAAVMAHENGPAIAYHLANDEDALFNLAAVRPELQAAAVARLASRLSAAPPPQEAPAAAIAPPAAKPISQAPPPPPRVGGRAPASTPPEKMTDDDWYKADRERRRKR